LLLMDMPSYNKCSSCVYIIHTDRYMYSSNFFLSFYCTVCSLYIGTELMNKSLDIVAIHLRCAL
jgi:hypothetical protein